MKKINKLISEYSNHTFSSGGTTGPDYKSFERKYRNILKEVAGNIGAELISFSKNHYSFSAFIKKEEKFVYISISDVRHFPNEWQNNILIRTATNEKDYSGGFNQYTTLENLESKLEKMLP